MYQFDLSVKNWNAAKVIWFEWEGLMCEILVKDDNTFQMHWRKYYDKKVSVWWMCILHKDALWSYFVQLLIMYLTIVLVVVVPWHIYSKMSHSSKNVTFIQKCHIHPKMAHSSKNGKFIQKCDIHPKMWHSSKNGTFLQKWHIPPIMAHSSKNSTFLQKWHIPPEIAHSSINVTFLQ